MKKIVIPLTLFISIIFAMNLVSTTSDYVNKAKDGDVEGIADELAEDIVEETKEEVMEPLWILLVRNPVFRLLGVIGSALGIKFVIK